MCDYLKVNEVFPIANGLIAHIGYDFPTEISVEQLDILFISNFGERAVSPLVYRFITGLLPTDEQLSKLGLIVKSYYFTKWENLKKLHSLEYDPIHNYLDQLDETITGNDKVQGSKSSTVTTDMTQTGTGSNTRTDNLTEKNVSQVDTTDNNNSDASVYGFNSADAVKSNLDTESVISQEKVDATKSNTGTQSTANSSTNTNKGTVIQANTNTTNDDKTQTRTSKHSGNIGNLTTQQLFTQEIELRKWMFIDAVLQDIKELITLPVYM